MVATEARGFNLRTLLFAAFAVSALALAQAPAASPPAAGTTNERSDAENVPDAEKISRTTGWLERMRASLAEVIGKLEEARNLKDVVKLNCVNEKLTQMKGLLRISEQAGVALQESVAKKETQAATDEYVKISIANTKVSQLRSEAEECIGQLAFRVDEKQVLDVDEPDDLPKSDPSIPATVAPPPVRPLAASPTM